MSPQFLRNKETFAERLGEAYLICLFVNKNRNKYPNIKTTRNCNVRQYYTNVQ